MASRKRRVLIVDDDPSVRAFVARVVADDADVVEAGSMEQAASALRAREGKRFDVALVNCGLAGGRGPAGVALVDRIRRQSPWIPIIAVIGANSSDSLIIDAFHRGAGDVLKKPFSAADLRTAIVRVAPRWRVWSSSAHPSSKHAISGAVKFIDEHYTEPLSLTLLASMARMSRSYFCHGFRSVVGASVRAYVRDLRLRRAQQLLSTSAMSVTDIAVEVGFYDLPHFDKVFRRRFGFSPTEFQRRIGLIRATERRRIAQRPRDVAAPAAPAARCTSREPGAAGPAASPSDISDPTG